ncbi:MAG TPA: RNA polymerase sigma factor [Terriglobales bacterium]|nr:RNA polymerase sigma factor [Terriglobales bacterium]
MRAFAIERTVAEACTDEELVKRVLAGEVALYELLMRRYNQRLFRVSVAILKDSAEAEDAMQEAYVRAYQHLGQWEGRAKFSTWLTRIAVHEALARAERRRRYLDVNTAEDSEQPMSRASGPSPEEQVSERELHKLLETVILGIPQAYRTVLMMRDVEEMSTSEVAGILQLTEENVKVRLFRARAMARKRLFALTGATSVKAFEFGAARCDRVVSTVLNRINSAG